VRDAATGRGITGATVEVWGANVNLRTTTDSSGAYRLQYVPNSNTYYEIKASAANYNPRTIDGVMGSRTLDFDLAAIPLFQYSGVVRDGVGTPVVGAMVEGGGNVAITDSAGRYSFTSPYDTVAGRVRPPDGYEPNPVRLATFPLVPGQDLVVRRITNVTIRLQTTIGVGDYRYSVEGLISFDTGAVERPLNDTLELRSSDPTVLITGYGGYVQGVKAGTAQVTGYYFGVASAPVTVQVQ